MQVRKDRIALLVLVVTAVFGCLAGIPGVSAQSLAVDGIVDGAESRTPYAATPETNPLRSRAASFLRRASPFGRKEPGFFDVTIAQYVAGAQWTDPDLVRKLATLLRFLDPMPTYCDTARDSYLREELEILRGIHAEMQQGTPVQTVANAKWRELLPPPSPPHYVQRPVNDGERELLSLLQQALNGDIEQGLRQFEEAYRGRSECAVPWDTRLGEAIHDFASEIEYFEPKADLRKVSDIFYGPDDLRERIRKVLAAQPLRGGNK